MTRGHVEIPDRVVLGSRGSRLARLQAELVGRALSEAWPGLEVTYRTLTTTGDRRREVAIPEIVKAGGGSVINMSSNVALMALPGRDCYTAAKGGVASMTRSMAVEYAPDNIRVNAIAPGYILTEINKNYFASEDGQAAIKKIPQRRVPDPSALDGTLLLLASSRASSFMTGSTIVIDGGHLLTGGQ